MKKIYFNFENNKNIISKIFINRINSAVTKYPEWIVKINHKTISNKNSTLSILNKKVIFLQQQTSLFKYLAFFQKRFFAGCGSKECGCSHKHSQSPSENTNELKLKSMNYDVIAYIEEGKYDEALILINDYLKLVKEVYSEEHKYYLSGLNNKAFLLKLTNKKEEAKDIYLKIIDCYKTMDVEAENIIIVKQNLATLLRDLKQNTEAIEIFEELFKLIKEHTVKPNIEVNIYCAASGSYRAIGQFSVAEEFLNIAEKLVLQNFGENTLPYATILNQKGLNFREQKKYEDALTCLRRSLEIKESILDKTHPEALFTRENIIQLYLVQGEKTKAQEILNETDILIKNNKEKPLEIKQ